MSLREGLRLYPKAITWSVLISLTLIMEGYSTILVPNLFSMGPFVRRFGSLTPSGHYEISAMWQTLLVNCSLIGQIIGLVATGFIVQRLGYRGMLQGGLVAFSAAVFLPVFSTTRGALLAGQLCIGVPLGVFQCISASYAVEVCPVGLRAYLTTYINACWVLGQLIASIVLRIMVGTQGEWSYRLPFALQWVFPLPIYVAVWYAPESPWYLVGTGRVSEARLALERLRTKMAGQSNADFQNVLSCTLESMVHTMRKEKEMQKGAGYLDCFKGVDRRRTEIACMTWMIQTFCGSTFMGFSTYFYEQAGLGKQHAFTLSLVQFAVGLLGVGVSWLLMLKLGRRTLYISGQVLTFIFVLLIGLLGVVQPSTATRWSVASLLLLFTITYDATIGPICYSLVSEIPSTRLRALTIALARNCYNVSGIVANIITPQMLNPTAWNWGAKTGFFWAGTSIVGIAWSWWRLPEPKGRTFGELDDLFEKRVSARRFKSTDVVAVSGSIVSEMEEDGGGRDEGHVLEA
ncbi:hypothetical protein ACN47E_007427 [Coniothyrium glycines]